MILCYMIKRVSLFNLLFKRRPESQSASLPYNGVSMKFKVE